MGQSAQPTVVVPTQPAAEHGRRHRRAKRRRRVAGTGGTLAGPSAPTAAEAPGPSPIGATVGLPPEPLAAAGIGGQGNPLGGSPFPPGQVPGFFIETYRVPPVLLPIYQNAAARYGVPWEVLAGINEVETDYGQDLSVSSAGAEGWMQFLPQTWAEYGVDATGKGVRDPYDPADAIFAAARYLRAADAAQSLTGAIYAYNHSSLYVESVMLRARLLAGVPPALLTALTAIGQGRPALGLAPALSHKLMRRLAELPQPRVPRTPTSAALPDRPGGVDLPPPAQVGAPAPGLAGQGSAGAGGAGSPGANAGGTAGAGGVARTLSDQLSGGLSFQPQLGLPAGAVNMIGAAPQEAPGAVWATGVIGAVPAQVGGRQISKATVLLRHDAQSPSWQVVPVADEHGGALAFNGTPSVTAAGGIVLLSSTPDEHGAERQTLITRDPGGGFVQAPAPPGSGPEAVLAAGETLYPAPGSPNAPLFTAIDDGGHTGALLVPAAPATVALVHYDGEHWTREEICTQYTGGICSDSAAGLKVLAVAASSPQNAWMLGSSGSEPLMLFKRTAAASGPPVWVQSQPVSWAPAATDAVFARPSGQMLTVTSQGVWVDAALTTPASPNEAADISLLLDAASPSTVLGTWCFPQSACGLGSLGAPLPSNYRSFAWPGAGSDEGTRIIAGLEDGALLRFQHGGDFSYLVGGGGNASSDAAFVSPEEGWIADAANAGVNSAQVEHVTSSPASSGLQAWPLPFRRPLTAIAAQPGTAPGDPGAQALAVGDQGQIARYLPGEGWTREFLYQASGAVATPRLRGVAWPEAGRAYAVGDEGAMWLWRSDTGLWEPDPAKPLNFHANLTAVAFSAQNPTLGYAVGKQGALLAYGKTWTQQPLPEGLGPVNLTSIAFAGGEALATYRTTDPTGGESGGLIVNDGSGWRVDPTAQALLTSLPDPRASVLSRVAGLPDGGAVAAGPGVVIERDSAGAPWRFSAQPLPDAQNISALAAIRSGPQVQALVSVDLAEISNPNSLSGFIFNLDNPVAPGFGQPGLQIAPDPLPVSGYLLRETAAGWQDIEGQAYPSVPSITSTDLPNWPDAVLALDVDPGGARGWAVGGQTGGIVEQSHIGGAQFTSQSAAALRLGGDIALPQSEGAPIPTPAGQVTFALGGNAQCAGPCADLANEGTGPDAWLSSALGRAAGVSGLRAFLYSGARVAGGAAHALSSVPGGFARELAAYRGDLQAAGSLPVYVAPSPSDADAGGGLGSFAAAMGADSPAPSVPSGTPATPAGSGAFAFESAGNGGTVRVVVLDFSAGTLGAGELGWLAEQLVQARGAQVPVLVMGNADIANVNAPNYDAQDAAALTQVLLNGGASAYLFDSVGENRAEVLGAGANAIPALGSGTLGYVPPSPLPEEFLGASGFVLASVNAAARDPHSNRAPVSATLVPSISQLAIDPTDGTLLRRSQVALFRGLARRPAGGLELEGGTGLSSDIAPDPYVPIPENCIGSACAHFIAPAYTFTSSRPDIGNFVAQEPSNPNPRAVALNAAGKPIPDPHSGLFCAFNAGTTTISITTGGLTYSQQITVQAGSVVQPCGTVPLVNPPANAVSATAPVSPPPPASPAPSGAAPLSVVPPPPPPLAPAPIKPPPPVPPRPAPLPQPFFFRPLLAAPFVAIVLPPPPVLARPIPPSGAATVSVPAVAPKEEQEDEEAVENARASMSAYTPEDHHLPALSLLALIVLAAGAGTSIRRAGRGPGTRMAPAYAQSRVRSRVRW